MKSYTRRCGTILDVRREREREEKREKGQKDNEEEEERTEVDEMGAKSRLRNEANERG